MKKNTAFLIGLFVALSATIAQAQNSTTPAIKPYFLDIKQTTAGRIHDVKDKTLFLEYYDNQGTWKELPIRFYNWKNEQVAVAALAKAFGANYFQIDLNQIYSSWEDDKVYSCRVVDETKKKYELSFQFSKPKGDKPTLDIIMNPISLNCEIPSNSVAEFYGSISGGKAPYTVNWVVANDNQSALLYQPKQEVIENADRSSMITVDKAPAYYVLMQVKDACGEIEQKVLYVSCDNKNRKVNTIFVEPLHNLSNLKTKITN